MRLPALGFLLLLAANALGGEVLLTEARIRSIRARIRGKVEPTRAAFLQLERAARAALGRRARVPGRWHVPSYYKDEKGHNRAKNGLRDDANAAYALALHWRLTGERRFAASAARLVDAWAVGPREMSREANSALSFCYHFPALVLAADLLRRDPRAWPAERQEKFARFLKERALPMSTSRRSNNWGNWGNAFEMAVAAYLGDRALLERAAARWKELLDGQLAPDGHLPREVSRSGGRRGIWYSHFCLMPQTLAAEIARVNGVDLYAHRTPGNATLATAFRRLAGWSERPETFPYYRGDPGELVGVEYVSYFELLNARWPSAAATRLLRRRRPLTADHAFPFLTLTHGALPTDDEP